MKLISLLTLSVIFTSSWVNAQRQWGDLRYGELRRVESKYDPIHRSTPLARRIGVMVFSGLVSFDKDHNRIPQLTSLTKAELQSYQPINDVVYIFPLRTDILWHDDEVFDAYDVLFTYLAMKNDLKKKESVDFIASVEVIDSFTIQFTLAKPILNAFGKLSFQIIPHHLFVPNEAEIRPDNPECQVPPNHTFVQGPIGTGPYRFDPYAPPSDEVHLLVNPNYPILEDGRNRAWIDKVIMRPFSDDRAQANSVAFGGVDLVVELPATLVDSVIQDAEAAGRYLWRERYQSMSYYFFALNHDHPFLGGEENQLTRQAIHYATNRAEWLNRIENDSGILISGPFPHDSPYADSSVDPYPYEVDKARNLLAQAGFADTDEDGTLDKDGKPFTLTLKQMAGRQKEAQICEAFIADLQQIGIQVNSNALTSEEEWKQQIYYKHDFDVVLDSWAFSIGATLYPLLHSSQSFPGGKNYISYNNLVVDITLDLFKEETDPAALQNLGRELHRMLRQESPYIFLWTPLRIAVGDIKIRNVQIHPDVFFNYITEWWLQ
ncbi:TPA: hypothetical protein EYG59_03280 [Candidatus Poribacteria bacterium]|nr:hypothetical protein [Flavobacteriales bacterium]HIO77590.1 hypothetical protein [Candidatus Poribacteria bacterium]